MTKNTPTVSVIIPTYNRSVLLPRSIRSVLNQTFQDFELIVVDDGSTDNTEEVVRGFEDKRIRYIQHEENKGGSAARNTGVKVAQGEYIALLDDDDEWLPEKLERQINKFQELSSDFGVVYSGFSFVYEKSGEVVSSHVPAFRGNVYDRIIKSCILGGSTPLIKKFCFQKAGLFDESLPSCQDWDICIRISKYYNFDFVPDALMRHYAHGTQISVDLSAKIRAREKLIEKYSVELYQKPRILSALLTRLGILYALSEDYIKARKYFFASIKKEPFRRNNYIHLFLSILLPQVHKAILKRYFIKNINGIEFYY